MVFATVTSRCNGLDGESDVVKVLYHECKRCGLQEPCTGKVDCMLCLQAKYFVLNQHKQPEPETKPQPEPKRRKLIKLEHYKI